MHSGRSTYLKGIGLATAAALAGALLGQVVTTSPTTQATEAATTQATPAEELAQSAARTLLTSGLMGSKHDFSRGLRGRDLCLPCHTPHLVAAPPPQFDRRPTTTQPLRPYRGADVELNGWSLLCLGCHDGITAPDVYSTAHAVSVRDQLANSRLGVRARRSHPVGIKYPTIQEGYEPLVAVEAAGLPMPEGRIQCATCHDAHNTNRHNGLLRMSNERSRLCLICHRV